MIFLNHTRVYGPHPNIIIPTSNLSEKMRNTTQAQTTTIPQMPVDTIVRVNFGYKDSETLKLYWVSKTTL
jgi:hypothetical protein